MIWHGAPNPAVVYVGQGNIRERILAHRDESAITQYRGNGLYVTWAPVLPTDRDGLERYLAERWNPLVGRAYPQITPIQVNSPWS